MRFFLQSGLLRALSGGLSRRAVGVGGHLVGQRPGAGLTCWEGTGAGEQGCMCEGEVMEDQRNRRGARAVGAESRKWAGQDREAPFRTGEARGWSRRVCCTLHKSLENRHRIPGFVFSFFLSEWWQTASLSPLAPLGDTWPLFSTPESALALSVTLSSSLPHNV